MRLNYYLKLRFFDIIVNFVFRAFRVKPYFVPASIH